MKPKFTVDEIRQLVARNQAKAIQLLQTAVQIPSPTGQEGEISNFFADYMKSFGLEVQKYEYESGRPNLLAEWVGKKDGKKFIFNGHMDVFPPTEGITGKFSPWSGTIEDGKLYGRGSTDMKAGDCAAMMAVQILKESGYVPNGKILLSYMVDEENNSKMGSLALLEHGLLKDGDFGICMEPSSGKLLMEEGGVWQIEITYYASGGHTTYVTDEEDALMKSIHAINELYKLKDKVEKRSFPGLGHPFLQIGVIHAGTVSNVRASQSTFTIDRRFAAAEEFKAVKQEILDVLDRLKAKDPAYDYTLKEIAYYPSAKRDINNPAIKTIMQAIEDINGEKAECFARYGSSDATHIIDQTQIPMPIYGPSGDGMGRADEYVELDDYLSAIMVYIRAIDLLLGEKDI